MKKEIIAKAATIEAAIEQAVAELNVSRDDCEFEVLETPRKTLFGKLREAVVKVTAEIADVKEEAVTEEAPVSAAPVEEAKEEAPVILNEKLATAQKYLADILHAMGLDSVTMDVKETEDGAVITFNGDEMAVLIGHHGETLDALQYLVALTCNRINGEYYRITLDCGNYRQKREKTLKELAERIAIKVKKTGRSQLLEPMNPYERRIIHSVVSEIEGVYSKSKGEEPNRRVVILSENPVKSGYNNRSNHRREDYPRKSYPSQKREPTMEEILKSDIREREESAQLYSKIEL